MEKKLDLKVDFLKNFRLSEGISRTNLNKLSYYLKDKNFRRRDIVFKEGQVADGIYFIKEGEFEVNFLSDLFILQVSKKLQTKLDQIGAVASPSKGQANGANLQKIKDIKVSIIGPNDIIGLEDMIKNDSEYKRRITVTCVSDKAFIYFLSREDYFTRFYKQM